MQQGDYVLITAAASGVGLAAIQLATAVGAISIATTRNKPKENSLQEAGAKFVVNTKADGWAEKVREITSGKGVDLAFDPVASVHGIERPVRQDCCDGLVTTSDENGRFRSSTGGRCLQRLWPTGRKGTQCHQRQPR